MTWLVLLVLVVPLLAARPGNQRRVSRRTSDDDTDPFPPSTTPVVWPGYFPAAALDERRATAADDLCPPGGDSGPVDSESPVGCDAGGAAGRALREGRCGAGAAGSGSGTSGGGE